MLTHLRREGSWGQGGTWDSELGNTKFAMLFTFPVETFSRQLDRSLEFRDMGWRNNTALKIHQCEVLTTLGVAVDGEKRYRK